MDINNVKNQFLFQIQKLNSSKFFAGIVMLMLNIGSKYISINLSKTQEQYLRNSIGRQLLIFSIAWIGSRDIILSLFLTATFVVLSDYLFNENSKFCILPERWKQFEDVLDTDNDNKVSDEEVKNAIEILQKAKDKEHKRQQLQMVNSFN